MSNLSPATLSTASRELRQRLAGQPPPRRLAFGWVDTATAWVVSLIAGIDVEIVARCDPASASTNVCFTPAALSAVRAHGFTGLADAWTRGEWSAAAPADVLARPARLLARTSHTRLIDSVCRAYLARTTTWQLGAERGAATSNAEFHYELPAALFASFLDDSMTYSSAVFDDACRLDLETAQRRKRQQLLELAELAPEADVLDVGCGWGALLVDLSEAGHTATGITLSRLQAAHANALALAGGGSFSARVADYRDVETDAYDAVFSVEMIEAVGARDLDEYFRRLRDALRSEGCLVIQAIVTAPLRVVMTRRRSTWIRRHIFPGGQLVSRHQIIDSATRAGFRLARDCEIGHHYVRTLRLWTERFERSSHELREHGASEEFLRMWQFYLGMCQAGFEGGDMECLQMVFVRNG